jgi:hypothetical protein
MFGRRPLIRHNTAEAEQILGVVLAQRATLLNVGDMCKDNIFLGEIIGSAFAHDQQQVQDIFDSVAAFIAMDILEEEGFETSMLDEGLRAVLANGLEDATDSRQYTKFLQANVASYRDLTDVSELAKAVLEHTADQKLQPRNYDALPKFVEQLRAVRSLLHHNILQELRAGN